MDRHCPGGGAGEWLPPIMKTFSKWIVIGFATLGVFFALEQHPYRDGKRRMEQYFGPILPAGSKLVPLSLWKGSYWDDPRFRFNLGPEDFDAFSKSVAELGYSKWEESGGKYGSFNEESTEGDRLLCSSKHSGRVKLMLYYRPSTGIVDAITYYH